MCGIVGIFDHSGSAIDRDLLGRMSGAIRHRGPDGEGQFIAPGVGLGIKRLSIIDVEGGTQPLTNEDGHLHLVFNGEIFNYVELRKELIDYGHRFKTQSDTEVIVHAYEQWGSDCVTRFNGMFAFALWNEERRELLLARDHLGVKPLYYVKVDNRTLFGSEIKALLEDSSCPRDVDLQSLGQLFSLRYVPSPDTLFREIKKLPPGHLIKFNSSGMAMERFWNAKPVVRKITDEGALIEEYQELLEDAVRLQMRSDVAVGLFLSSGMDSCTLLSLMSHKTAHPISTFTIGFENNRGRDEVVEARQAARMFGADHTELILTARDYQEYYQEYLWNLEEPLGNESAAAFYFVSRIARQKVKVALCGEGADELWAGYDRYRGLKLSRYYSRLPAFVTSILGSPFFERIVRNEKLKRGLLALDEKDTLSRFVKIHSFYSQEMKAQLFQPWIREHVSIDGSEAKEALSRLQTDVKNLDLITQMQYIDTRSGLPDDLLMVCDKTAMANSLEVRVPFLDVRIVEFVESLPPSLKLCGLTQKYLHKKACRKWIPKEIANRKKKGFANPVDIWLRSTLRAYAHDCLLSESSSITKYFNRSYIEKILYLHESGIQNYLRHIQLLVSFELWHRMYISGNLPKGAGRPAYECL
jgi:asparagine synthase (glutamine-hydrolysing)